MVLFAWAKSDKEQRNKITEMVGAIKFINA
jgi:hypothetical protein